MARRLANTIQPNRFDQEVLKLGFNFIYSLTFFAPHIVAAPAGGMVFWVGELGHSCVSVMSGFAVNTILSVPDLKT
jgi:hypothetical protein